MNRDEFEATLIELESSAIGEYAGNLSSNEPEPKEIRAKILQEFDRLHLIIEEETDERMRAQRAQARAELDLEEVEHELEILQRGK